MKRYITNWTAPSIPNTLKYRCSINVSTTICIHKTNTEKKNIEKEYFSYLHIHMYKNINYLLLL